MKKYLTLLVLGASIVHCAAKEKDEKKKAIEFDDKKPIRELLAVVRKEIGKGEKDVVKLSSGEFHLVKPKPAKKKEKDEPRATAKPLTAKLADKKLSNTVENWAIENRPKQVMLKFDTDAKSEHFFKIAKILRKQGIHYTVLNADSKVDGEVKIMPIEIGEGVVAPDFDEAELEIPELDDEFGDPKKRKK